MIWLLLACAPEPLALSVDPVEGGIEITSTRPVDRVELYDIDGQPIVARSLPSAQTRVHVAAPLASGATYRVSALAGGERTDATVDLPAVGPFRVEIEAPVGQGRRPVLDGDEVGVLRVDGSVVHVAVHLVGIEAVEVQARLGAVTGTYDLRPDERAIVRIPVDGDLDEPLVIEGGGHRIAASLQSATQSVEEARAALSVVGVVFPTDGFGNPDPARPADRVTLPSGWWRDGLGQLGLGYRPRGDQAPWAWQAVTLRNEDPVARSVVVRSSVVQDGAPAPAFRTRIREDASASVSVLLRVPASGAATAVLPVFVAADEVEAGTYTRRIEVVPLGSDVPLHREDRPLLVTIGSAWASGGFAIAALASLLGYATLLLRGRRWVAERRTSELVTVALFGSLTFVVGAAFQVLGMGIATVLGPFAPLLTGLPDDAFRACLLGTLVTLVPRPGVVALATIVGFLMRGLALGSFHPVDLIYLGSAVFWLESALWLAGPTRVADWADRSRASRWLRLGLGLGVANVCATASALVVSVVLYRLFFADWYVLLILALPGFLYVLIGAWIAVDFAAALRRVAP